mmetsp:Transcript_91002/g.237072  ORF Transcript_91002/g.237072 Transcript_91002/m.237072 type:complete len:366 (+) Transcript_91002:720-1817(+)
MAALRGAAMLLGPRGKVREEAVLARDNGLRVHHGPAAARPESARIQVGGVRRRLAIHVVLRRLVVRIGASHPHSGAQPGRHAERGGAGEGLHPLILRGDREEVPYQIPALVPRHRVGEEAFEHLTRADLPHLVLERLQLGRLDEARPARLRGRGRRPGGLRVGAPPLRVLGRVGPEHAGPRPRHAPAPGVRQGGGLSAGRQLSAQVVSLFPQAVGHRAQLLFLQIQLLDLLLKVLLLGPEGAEAVLRARGLLVRELQLRLELCDFGRELVVLRLRVRELLPDVVCLRGSPVHGALALIAQGLQLGPALLELPLEGTHLDLLFRRLLGGVVKRLRGLGLVPAALLQNVLCQLQPRRRVLPEDALNL